jgi:hypothetical protein
VSDRALKATAAAILVIDLALVVGGAVLAGILHELTLEGYWFGAAVGWVFTAVGALVTYRRPREPMGWLMLAVGGFWTLAVTGGEYATLDYRVHAGRLPLGWLAALTIPLWVAAFVSLALAVILFPDGRLPSARWRWPLRLLLGLSAVWALCAAIALIPLAVAGTIRIDPNQDIEQVNHPMHESVAAKAYGITLVLVGLCCALMIVAWLLSQLVSYRRLTGERRAQQKWILAGVTTSFIAITLSFALGNDSSTFANVLALCIVAMPLTMGVGILKYRLYEIDRIISRTLAYAIVTALLAGTFVGLVVLSTHVLPFSSTVGVAASTLAAAALFNPLRVRVQRAVDRRFNRSRYDAEATIAAFAGRLRDAVDVDAVQTDLLSVVSSAVQPAHASVWMREVSR